MSIAASRKPEKVKGMRGQFEVPKGLVAEKTLRSLIRSIATRLAKEKFTVKETLALLREQERLSKQLRETAAARMEAEQRKGADKNKSAK